MNKEYKVICFETIKKSMMHDDEMIKQFVELYLIQCPIDLQNLKTTIQSEDVEKIGLAAHHIKPTMEYIGAKDLKSNFQTLENLGRNQAPFDQLLTLYKKIEQEFELMLKELQHLKDNL